MIKFLWGLSAVAALIGGIAFWIVFFTAGSAPQQAAGAGLILAFVIPPYIFARAFDRS